MTQPPASAEARRRPPRAGLAVALAAAALSGWSAPASAESASGVILAGRHAAVLNDFPAAARYFRRATRYAPDSSVLLRNAVRFSVYAGDVRLAWPLAQRLMRETGDSRIARLTAMSHSAATARWEEVADLIAGASGEGLTELTRVLVGAWASVGRGEEDAALAALTNEDVADVVRTFAQYHLGLIQAQRGDHAAAVVAFDDAAERAGAWSLRLATAAAASHQRLGDLARARALLEAELERDPFETRAKRLIVMLDGDEPLPLVVSAPVQGVAETFHTLAAALADGRGDAPRQGLGYARLALHLRPEADETRILIARILGRLRRHGDAAAVYAEVPADSPLSESAMLGHATSLNDAGDRDGALRELADLTARGAERPTVYFSMAEVLNAAKRYDDCIGAYQAGLDLLPSIQPHHWIVEFGLGICFEREDRWPEAEAAFNRALALNEDQPDVLNYLGYSLIEKTDRFDEARGLIEKAAAARPESGYIVDSLGWVLYRLGDFEGAARELERAVSLSPTESVINDHLGDALWMIGRKMEARFQWKRALSFGPETDDETARIERKLKVGLDAVLAEEAEAGAGRGETADGAQEPEAAPTEPQGG